MRTYGTLCRGGTIFYQHFVPNGTELNSPARQGGGVRIKNQNSFLVRYKNFDCPQSIIIAKLNAVRNATYVNGCRPTAFCNELFETVKMQQGKAVRLFLYCYPFYFSLVEKFVVEWIEKDIFTIFALRKKK